MPEFLTQQPVLSLIVAAVTALIVLWAVARRAPGNLPMIIGVGLLIGAVGAGIVAYQFAEQKARETAALEAKKKALEQAREKKLREEQARKKAAEAERRKARNQAEKAAREKAARDKAAAERRRAAQLSPRSVGQSGASNQPPTAAPKGVTGGSAAPESAAADARKKWDVVPVFYGTDREAVADGKRARYSAGRGERLEVGRALVTVPKSHEVPNIERPWVYKIPFFNVEILREEEDPAKHFTMREVQRLTQDQFIALARARISESSTFKDQALVFVHGFNTTFDYAVYRAAQLSYDLKFDGGSFVYSWPSRGEVSATGYTWDSTSAENAEDYLKEFLTLIAKRSGAKAMTVIAHSMGNKLLLPVLEKLNADPDNDIKISQVILAAPDVDRNIFTKLARKIKGISKGITLYAAANDRALDVSEQFWGGGPRAGDVPAGGPVVVTGVDTIDVTETSTEVFALNHAGYAEKTQLLADIRDLMLKGYQAPNLRMPSLEQKTTTDGGRWWKIPRTP